MLGARIRRIRPLLLAAAFLCVALCGPPAAAGEYTAPNALCKGGLQVNTHTGNLFYARQGLQIPATGIDLDLTFSYNSGETRYDYGYGRGWSHTYNIGYEKIGVDVSVKNWDGNRKLFTFIAGQYRPPVGCHDSLSQYSPGRFRLRLKHGLEYDFADSTHRQVTSIRDRNGNTVTITYSGGHPTRITDATGRSLTLLWSDGLLTQVTDFASPIRTISYLYNSDLPGTLDHVRDPSGNTIHYRYDLAKRLVGVTDGIGVAYEIAYDDSGAVTRIRSPLSLETFTYDAIHRRTTHSIGGRATTYEFDPYGRVIEIAGSCCGFHRRFQYDGANNINALTDANDHVTTYAYDSCGNCLRQVDPLGNVTSFTYDPVFNLITSITDPAGSVTTMTYDDLGNCTSIAMPLQATFLYSYDDFGQLASATDARGYTTTFTYDNHGNRTGVNHPIGSEEFTYDAVGNMLTHTDANGHTTRNAYDTLDRLVSMANPLNEITAYAYDGNDNLVSVTNPNGNDVQITYDALNRATGITDGLGLVEVNAYDESDNVVSTTDGNGNATTYGYDEQSRIVVVSRGATTERFAYDAAGNVVAFTDGNGQMTACTYDAMNRRTSTSTAGITKVTAFDARGNVVGRTDGMGNQTTFIYNERNERIQTVFPDGSFQSCSYDGNGNLVSRTDNAGRTTTFVYDGDNRLALRHPPDPQEGDDEYEYDLGGRMIAASNRYAAIAVSYDDVGRVLSETMNGHTTGYSYDTAARRRTVVYPGGSTAQELRDLRERLASVTQGSVTVTFGYDAGGRLSTTDYGDGQTTDYGYDDRDLLTQLAHRAAGQLVAGYAYAYDDEGNRTMAVDEYDAGRSEATWYTGPDWLTGMVRGAPPPGRSGVVDLRGLSTRPTAAMAAFTGLGPLSEAGGAPDRGDSTLFGYDRAGSWTSVRDGGQLTTYNTNNLNQYTASSPGGSYGYDANGNLLSGNSFSGQYDWENRLRFGSLTDSVGPSMYLYDPLGRRVQKVVNGTVVNYYYDGNRVIEERDGTDAVNAVYLYGDRSVDDLLTLSSGGGTYVYVTDGIGSVVAMTNLSGEVVERYEYAAFGAPTIWDGTYSTRRPSSVIGNRHLFTGREYDAEVGLYYYRARHYSPVLGRFIQRDPLGVWGDPMARGNGYTYVGNNPLTYVDPLGTGPLGDAMRESGRAGVGRAGFRAVHGCGCGSGGHPGPGSQSLSNLDDNGIAPGGGGTSGGDRPMEEITLNFTRITQRFDAVAGVSSCMFESGSNRSTYLPGQVGGGPWWPWGDGGRGARSTQCSLPFRWCPPGFHCNWYGWCIKDPDVRWWEVWEWDVWDRAWDAFSDLFDRGRPKF